MKKLNQIKIISLVILGTLVISCTPIEQDENLYIKRLEEKNRLLEQNFNRQEKLLNEAQKYSIDNKDKLIIEAEQSQADSLDYMESSAKVHDTIEAVSFWLDVFKILTD